MKTLVEETGHEAVLERFRGGKARLWLYHATLSRLAFMLQLPEESGVAYLVAVGCEYIRAPVRWSNIDISIMPEPQGGDEAEYHRIVDKLAGVEVQCGGVFMLTAPELEVDKSFEDFLGPQE